MKFSLKKKTIFLIVFIAVVTSALAIVVYNKGIRDVITSQYESRSIEISKLVAVNIDSERVENVQKAVVEIYKNSDNVVLSDQWDTPEFDAFIAQFAAVEETEDFRIVRDQLRKMQDVLDVDCLYITWMDAKNQRTVYLVDAAYEDACPPGCTDPFYFDGADLLKDPEVGYRPNITNTEEYGWIIATAMPIHNDRGEVIAFAAVDISMNDVISQHNRFLGLVLLAFIGLTVVVCIVGILLVNRFIIKPINKLSQAAVQYTHNKRTFSELNISRSDEIGLLADSMTQMEEEINNYVSSLEKTTNDLISAREHAERMDRAASIDALTKVRNKRAFDIECRRLNESTEPYAIAMIDMNGLKHINDTYGHEKGDFSINIICQIICRIYKYSPVYRVGGDEFIVLLENSDYENREALAESFRDACRVQSGDPTLEPWERVTAAIGYALRDPAAHDDAEQVLKRADEAMYENKKIMKSAN